MCYFDFYKNKMPLFYFCIDFIFTFVTLKNVKNKKIEVSWMK